MKTTHGPWFARDNGHFWEVVVSPDEFARSVADVPVTLRQPNEEAEKVARLLASAPDLLAERDRLKALNAELKAALNAELAALNAELKAALNAELAAALNAELKAALNAELAAALNAELKAALNAELKAALNAELAAALETLFKEEAPAYHDCTDNGESECAWCMASAALAKQKETT